MKQVLQSPRRGELSLTEVPVPTCGAGGVVVSTRCSVISAGTERMLLELGQRTLLGKARARPDLVKKVFDTVRTRGVRATAEQVFARLDEPVPLGYSASGDVVEAGRDAAGLQRGDRVAMAGAGYANHAEFNFVPRNLCAKIPHGVSYADAAFATVGAIALQGVRQAQPLIGERAVVIGLGLIGLLTVQILKANGCAVLGVDPDAERATLAGALGADLAVGSDAEGACVGFTGGRGADAVIIAAATPSSQPIELAAQLSRHKGRVVAVGLVGMQVPRDAFYRKELDLRLAMSYGPGRYDPDYEERGNDYPFGYVRFTEQRNLESFLYLVQQRKVTPSALVTHRLPFVDALDAYALIEGKLPAESTLDRRYLGIVLEYPEGARPERTVRRMEDRAAGARDGGIGVGLIGAGGFARSVLLPQIAKAVGARLTAVCTSTGRSATQAAERFGFAVATTDSGEVLERADTAAVFIATRHGSHAGLVAAALRAGKHVFVEKPLCLDDAELDEVETALQDARGDGFEPCLMVGFNRRFSTHAGALQAAFRDRGTPMVVNYRVNAGAIPAESWLHDPEEGGGRIIGECCHFVDFCTALIDSDPVSVVATSIASDARDVVPRDSSVITIRYADGSLATIQYLALGHRALTKERCEVFADGRSAVMDDFRTTRFHGGGRRLRGKQAKGFAEEIDAFLSVCRDGGPWPIPWSGIAATHRVCFGAVRSLETGTMVDVG
ncbi:MAG: bi-domain-containing oxidoreductase [Spirochaetaceae bacterium]|nr:bi-domain-containing oxidoreductase [Spirochaetaceae bacterium]